MILPFKLSHCSVRSLILRFINATLLFLEMRNFSGYKLPERDVRRSR